MAHWLLHAISNVLNPPAAAMSGFSRDIFHSPFFTTYCHLWVSRERPLGQELDGKERLLAVMNRRSRLAPHPPSIVLNHPRGIVDLRIGPGNSRPRGLWLTRELSGLCSA